jgi:hypothetical protein
LFLLFTGFTCPSFNSMYYYFNINIVKFDKSTISLLTVVAFVSLLCGTMIYNRYFKEKEIRTLVKYSIMVSYFGGVFGLMFVMRLNVMLGINDIIFIILTSVITDTLALAFSNMPLLVLFAKVTPHHIEATVFAFLTSVSNFSSSVVSPLMGAIINDFFVGVTLDNLEDFYLLVIIQLISIGIPLLYINLIPLRQEII